MSTLDSPQMIETTNVSARAIGIRYGLFASLILIVVGLIFYVTGMTDFTNQNSAVNWLSNIINWAVMAGAMVLGMKQYREAAGGYMTFGKGYSIGFWVSLLIALITAVWTILFFTVIAPDLMDTIMEATRDRMYEQGQSEEQVEQAMQYSAAFMNPYVFSAFAAVGILITGLIIDLIVSAIMQRKPPVMNAA